MADIITVQQMQDASQDAETLEQIVNGAPNTTVTTRLGRVVPTLATHSDNLTTDGIVQDNKTQRQINAETETKINSVSGGYFKAFDTLANLNAATGMTTGQVAKVMSDPTAANNGDYRYTGSAWVKGYDALTDAKAYTDSMLDGFISSVYDTSINLNLTNQTLDIATNAVRVNTSKKTILLNAQNMALPTNNGTYRIEFDEASGLLSTVTTATPKTGKLIVGWIRRVSASDYFICGFDYVVNGKKPNFNRTGFLIGVPSGINFDTVNNNLVIAASSVRVVNDFETYLLAAQTLALPSSGSYNLIYTKSTGALSWQAAATILVDGQLVVGGYVTLTQSVIGISAYSINGTPNTKYNSKGRLVGDADCINFDFNTNKLTITASKIRMLLGDATYLLGGKSVDIPTDLYWYRIVYDPTTGVLSFKRTSVALTASEVDVGYISPSTKTILDIDNYYVNGAKVGSDKSDLTTAELIVVSGNTDAGYVQNTQIGSFANFLSTAKHTDIYALYDALMSANPNYITKTSLGNDASGNAIYRYDFKAKEVTSETHSGYLPKIILVSGVHGFEKAGIMNLYHAMREICNNWQNDERLETLRWNCHFIVVPTAVPYGFDNHQRKNSNGVDIARNFTAEWVASNPSDTTYGGTAPLTELESQYLDTLMSNNKDAIAFWSHHNFGGTSDPVQFIWVAAATRFGTRLGKMLINRVSRDLTPRYSFFSQYPNGYVGISNINSPSGSEGKQATKVYGIQGGTFEISDNMTYASDTSVNSGIVATVGVEIFINWLLLNLEYAAKLYNSKINL